MKQENKVMAFASILMTVLIGAFTWACGPTPSEDDSLPLDISQTSQSLTNSSGFTVDGTFHFYSPTTSPQVNGLQCLDGSYTGIGVSIPPGGNNRVLIFMDGGGACWDANGFKQPCTSPSVVRTSFNASDFDTLLAGKGDINHDIFTSFNWSKTAGTRGIFDRSPGTANPFARYTFVFVPYCTGDLGQGANHDTSSTFRTPTNAYFYGASNFVYVAYQLSYVLGNVAPPSIVLSGGSAGGFAAYYNYLTLRHFFPSASVPVTVISDSAAPFATGTPNPSVPTQWLAGKSGYFLDAKVASPTAAYVEDDWQDAWHLNATISNYVTITPKTPSQLPGANANIYSQRDIFLAGVNNANYPNDRFASLMSTQDWVLPNYFRLQDINTSNSPSLKQGFDDFIANTVSVNPTKIKYVRYDVTTKPANTTAVPNASVLLPWNQHHTRMSDDVSLWGPQPGGSGLLAFFSSIGIVP